MKVVTIGRASIVRRTEMLERAILVLVLVGLYLVYGGLGRDMFANRAYVERGMAVEDPIGAVLQYLRLVMCLVTILIVVQKTSLNWALSKVPWQLAPFMLLALISYHWADDPKATFRSALVTTAMWVALPMLIHRLGLASVIRVTLHVIAIVLISSAAVAILLPAIGQHNAAEVYQTSHAGEWRGIFSHKNVLGPWAAWGCIFLFTHSWMSRLPRMYWWVARASAVACLVFANSATAVGMTAFLWCLWLFLILLRKVELSVVITALAGGLLMAVLFFFFLAEPLLETLGRDATFTGRTDIWSVDWFYITQQPWFGHGFQQVGGADLADRLFIMFGQPLGPESGYLALLLDMGFVGFALFFIPYFAAIKNGIEWLKYVVLEDRASLEMLICILLGSLLCSVTTADILISTGNDGIFNFTALFALLTVPKSPPAVLKGEFRLPQFWPKPLREAMAPYLPEDMVQPLEESSKPNARATPSSRLPRESSNSMPPFPLKDQ